MHSCPYLVSLVPSSSSERTFLHVHEILALSPPFLLAFYVQIGIQNDQSGLDDDVALLDDGQIPARPFAFRNLARVYSSRILARAFSFRILAPPFAFQILEAVHRAPRARGEVYLSLCHLLEAFPPTF